MRTRPLALVAVVACGGAAPAATAPASTASASPSAPPPATAQATAAPAPATPEGFRIASGGGVSFAVPRGWREVHPTGVTLAFASFDGDDQGMSVNAISVSASSGSLAEFAAGAAMGSTSRGASLERRTSFSVSGREVIENNLVTPKVTDAIRGVIRITTGREHVLLFTCHADEPAWSALRAGCDPILASIRVGAMPAGDRVPAGLRLLHGSDWRVTVPAAWSDTAPDSPDVRALVRSSNDRRTMLVLTVAEITPDLPPTPATRNATLAKVADFVAHKPGNQATVRSKEPNALDLDFKRELPSHATKLFQAAYEARGAFWLLTCGGLADKLEAHRTTCDTIFRSVRFDRPK